MGSAALEIRQYLRLTGFRFGGNPRKAFGYGISGNTA
jgi:hypothetical protein